MRKDKRVPCLWHPLVNTVNRVDGGCADGTW